MQKLIYGCYIYHYMYIEIIAGLTSKSFISAAICHELTIPVTSEYFPHFTYLSSPIQFCS